MEVLIKGEEEVKIYRVIDLRAETVDFYQAESEELLLQQLLINFNLTKQ